MKSNRAQKRKDRKSSGCGLCKPHKHGLAPARKNRDRVEHEQALKEIHGFQSRFRSS